MSNPDPSEIVPAQEHAEGPGADESRPEAEVDPQSAAARRRSNRRYAFVVAATILGLAAYALYVVLLPGMRWRAGAALAEREWKQGTAVVLNWDEASANSYHGKLKIERFFDPATRLPLRCAGQLESASEAQFNFIEGYDARIRQLSKDAAGRNAKSCELSDAEIVAALKAPWFDRIRSYPAALTAGIMLNATRDAKKPANAQPAALEIKTPHGAELTELGGLPVAVGRLPSRTDIHFIRMGEGRLWAYTSDGRLIVRATTER